MDPTEGKALSPMERRHGSHGDAFEADDHGDSPSLARSLVERGLAGIAQLGWRSLRATVYALVGDSEDTELV